MQRILDYGVLVNAKNLDGHTPLHVLSIVMSTIPKVKAALCVC